MSLVTRKIHVGVELVAFVVSNLAYLPSLEGPLHNRQ